jgi:hypothetical protein
MFGLSASSPAHRPASAADAPRSAALEAAVRRALGEAATVAGAYADPPVRFLALGAEAARAVARAPHPGDRDGLWVLVACRYAAEAGHQAHLQERCLTAAQRFTLALWAEGVEAVWMQDGLPDADALRRAGVDLGAHVPLGLVWCPEPEA